MNDGKKRDGGQSSTGPSEEGSHTIPESDAESRTMAPIAPDPEGTVKCDATATKPKDSRRVSGKSTKPMSTSPLRRSLRSKKPQPSFLHQASTRSQLSNRNSVRPQDKNNVKAADVEWVVEKILDDGIDSETLEHSYLVKWEGCGTEQSTWEPRRNLTGCREAIRRFEDTRSAYT